MCLLSCRCSLVLQRQNQTADAHLQNKVPAAGYSGFHGEKKRRSVSISLLAHAHMEEAAQPWGKGGGLVRSLGVTVVLSAGVERQFFGGDRPAGSQRGAEQPEEKQHQQLQRQPHLDPSSSRPGASRL